MIVAFYLIDWVFSHGSFQEIAILELNVEYENMLCQGQQLYATVVYRKAVIPKPHVHS